MTGQRGGGGERDHESSRSLSKAILSYHLCRVERHYENETLIVVSILNCDRRDVDRV